MKELLAKSDGTTFIAHSRCVEKIALFMARSFIIEDFIIERARLSGLLHDIAKCTAKNQIVLIDKNGKLEEIHQEIGWAILSNVMINGKNLHENILSSIYWHHANAPISLTNRGTSSRILENVSEADINLMLNLIQELTGSEITYEQKISIYHKRMFESSLIALSSIQPTKYVDSSNPL